MALIDIYRGEAITATAEIDSSTVFSAQVNGEDKITATFKSKVPLNLMIKDYILHKGLKYQILKFVDLDIDHEYTYGAVLMGTSYSLFAKPFINDAGLSTFTLIGTATQLLTILVGKINTIDSGWTVGTVEGDEVKEVQFINDNCRSALGRIFNAFGLEVSYVVKEISLTKRFELVDDAIPLAYGQNNGLYSLSKRVEGDFFTRVRGFGSTRNIPADYRGGVERLSFSPGYVDIEDAASYGDPIEVEVIFEDEYPNRTGTLSSVGAAAADGQVITDTSIDFNLADNFITGETPKIVMATGNWIGSEFEIITNSYDNTAKSFKIRPNKEGGYYFPNSTLPLQTGDTYVFIGINLPNSYVLAAEDRVEALTADYAATKPLLDVSYGLVIDPIHVIEEGLVPVLNVGQKIQITNVPAGINANMRITSITYPLIEPWKVTATISDKVQYSEEQQIARIVIENKKQLTVVKDEVKAVKSFTNIRLDEQRDMIFDPSGDYFDAGNYRPQSIETQHLNVGTRPQSFNLSIAFKPYWYGNATFEWAAGKLDHYTVVPGSIYSWNIPSGFVGSLVDVTAYNIYARCNKANSDGVIVLDTAERLVNADSTYYYFLIGSLSSVISGVRRIFLSYGDTDINGAFINTGAIASRDGKTVLDLDNGIFRGKLEFLKADNTTYGTLVGLADDTASAKAKTDLLKDLAYEDLVEAAMLGSTVIVGGYIKTDLIDVDYIKANFINAAYIETLDIDAVKGTIGGIEIKANSIESSNGKFKVTSGGIITATEVDLTGKVVATSGSIGGITISSGAISATKFSLTAAGSINAVDANISGTITATAGSIGGIAISAGAISATNFSLTAAGSIEAINAYFEDLEVVGLIAEDATITNASVTGSFTSTGAKSTINDTEISFNNLAGSIVKMTSGLTDYLGDSLGAGVQVGNAKMHGGGFVVGATNQTLVNGSGVEVYSITPTTSMKMLNNGFSINNGANVTKSASFTVSGTTYNFVNGLLVV